MLDKFEDMVGKTLVKIEGLNQYNDVVTFWFDDQTKMTMQHKQECCENVCLEDYECSDEIEGLVLSAEERTEDAPDYQGESGMYTFYSIRTESGYLDLRWCGYSNGYYSVGVDCEWEDLGICTHPPKPTKSITWNCIDNIYVPSMTVYIMETMERNHPN
jgi:hypothetical protein